MNQHLQEILSLCQQHASVLHSVYVTGSYAYGASTDKSDVDLVFIHRDEVSYGELKLLYYRLMQLKIAVEPFFVSYSDALKPQSFSHPLFVPMMNLADHGKLLYGESDAAWWKPSEQEIRDSRIWSVYLLLRGIERSFWNEEWLRSKYLPMLLWLSVAADKRVPASELGSGHRLQAWVGKVWPQSPALVRELANLSTGSLLVKVLSIIKPSVMDYLDARELKPAVYKVRFPSYPDSQEWALVTKEQREEWQRLDYRQAVQLFDFTSDFLRLFEELHQN